MIIVKNSCDFIHIERFPFCDNYVPLNYQLILQDTANKEVFIFDVSDLNEGDTPRMMFEICFPDDCLRRVTYDYYLVRQKNWLDEEINIDFPCKTYRKTDALVIMEGALFVVAGDRLVVAGDKNDGGQAEGPVTDYVEIYSRGLLKYMPRKAILACEENPYSCNDKKYTEYGG